MLISANNVHSTVIQKGTEVCEMRCRAATTVAVDVRHTETNRRKILLRNIL